MRANDAISGLVLIVLALAMIALTAAFPPFPGQKYGPALFPRILGAGLIICGAVMIWHGLAARARRRALGRDRALGARAVAARRASCSSSRCCCSTSSPSETVGFIPIALVFLAALFLWLGVRPPTASVLADRRHARHPLVLFARCCACRCRAAG